MHQVKLFVGVEQEIDMLERQVNEWIREHNARVLSITSNIAPQTPNPAAVGRGSLGDTSARRFSPSDIFLCVTYETD